MNDCFQIEASVADKLFKPKDLELKTIFLTFLYIYTFYMAHKYEPTLVFFKSETLIWVIIHFNHILKFHYDKYWQH